MDSSHLDLKNLFTRFAKIGNAASDGSILSLVQVEKWFVSANIIGDTLTSTDLSKKLQTQFKTPGIGFKDFLLFVEDLADSLNTSFDDLSTRLSAVSDPTILRLASLSPEVVTPDSVERSSNASLGNTTTIYPATANIITENTRPIPIPMPVENTTPQPRRESRDVPRADHQVGVVPFAAPLHEPISPAPAILAPESVAATRVANPQIETDPLLAVPTRPTYSTPTPTFPALETPAAPLNNVTPGTTPLPAVTLAKKAGKGKKKGQ